MKSNNNAETLPTKANNPPQGEPIASQAPNNNLFFHPAAPEDDATNQELKKQHLLALEKSSNNITHYFNLFQTYSGLGSLTINAITENPYLGNISFGSTFAIGGLVKAIKCGINLYSGDRSTATLLGLTEGPIELMLGGGMLVVGSMLKYSGPNSSSYTSLQLANMIITSFASALLTIERGYHELNSYNASHQSEQVTPANP